MDCPADNDEYSMETTPILLAAERNSYYIVKILLAHGAAMPSYEELKSKYSHLPTTQLTRIIYRYYNAISSEAYLLQTNGNLVTDIFNLFKDIKRAKREKKGMNDEFEMLTENLQAVSRKVLDLTRNEDEVRYLLAGNKATKLPKCVHCNQHIAIPRVIKKALLFNVKGFLAHDKCQAALTDLWYEGFFTDAQQSVVKRFASAALLTCLCPLLCLLYIVFPCGPIRRMMKTPFAKFVLHTVSRITFLALLIFTTLNLSVNLEDVTYGSVVTDDQIRAGYLSFRSADIHDELRICIFLWILGMTVKELNDFRRLGRKMYVNISCSIPDILQLVLYWLYVVLSFVVIVQTHHTIQDENWLSSHRRPTPPPPINCRDYPSSGGFPPREYSSVPDYPPSRNYSSIPGFRPIFTLSNDNDTSYDNYETETTTRSSTTDDTDTRRDKGDFDNFDDSQFISLCDGVGRDPVLPVVPVLGSGGLSVRFGGETRNDWASFDTVLLAEAAFALANILTFGGLLQTVIMISRRLGILAISLFGMVGDIVKFLILFSMTWISFSLGMTQLYRPFHELKLLECQDNTYDESECEKPAFIDLWQSMKMLFWSLFGLSELDSLHIKDGELGLTESLGHFMFALYLLVAVIVLLNALIAMMSSTYTRVLENAEMEWKYSRSIMMTGYILEGAVLPPPFNLIPDIWLFLSCLNPHKKHKLLERNTVVKDRRDHFEETNAAITKRYIFELQRKVTNIRLASKTKR
ncbi:short transient receptor potential channel 3-like isoform X2 [Amphiura filiformis]